MFSQLRYDLTVVWACARKEIKSGLSERTSAIVAVFLPVNFLILLSLFALSGGLAPTAVVLKDTGPTHSSSTPRWPAHIRFGWSDHR